MNKRLDVRERDRMLRVLASLGVLEALREARLWYPDAWIGGGLLRDLLHGVPPRDIDIFTFEPCVLREGGVGIREKRATSAEPPSEITGVADHDLDQAYEAVRIIEVEESYYSAACTMPIQIIHLLRKRTEDGLSIGADNAFEAIKQFHLGICQIALREDGTGFYTTPAFTIDCRDEVLTVRYCESMVEAERIVAKVNTLRERYPHHRFMIPSNLRIHFHFVLDALKVSS